MPAPGPPPSTPAPVAPIEAAKDSQRAGRRESGEDDSPSHDKPRNPETRGPRTVMLNGHQVRFELDEATDRPVIQVVDNKTGEVVRKVPPDEVRRLEAALRRIRGLLLDRYA